MPTNEEISEIADLRPEYEIDYRKAKPTRFALTEQQRVVILELDVSGYYWDSEAANRVSRVLIEVILCLGKYLL